MTKSKQKESKIDFAVPIPINMYLVTWLMESYDIPYEVRKSDEHADDVEIIDFAKKPIVNIRLDEPDEQALYAQIHNILAEEPHKWLAVLTAEIFELLDSMQKSYPFMSGRHTRTLLNTEGVINKRNEYRFFRMMEDHRSSKKPMIHTYFSKIQDTGIKKRGKEAEGSFDKHIVDWISHWFYYWLKNYNLAKLEFNTAIDLPTAHDPKVEEALVTQVTWRMFLLFSSFYKPGKRKYEAVDIDFLLDAEDIYPIIGRLLAIARIREINMNAKDPYNKFKKAIDVFFETSYPNYPKQKKKEIVEEGTQSIRQKFTGHHISFKVA